MSIGSIVGLAAGKISELLVQEAKLLYGVEDQVRGMETELTRMNAFLTDMEVRDEEEVDELSRTIINDIRKIAYDAEDVIESYILDASFPPDKMEAFFKRYVCFCSSLLLTHQAGSEIEAIKARLVETLGRWREYAGPNVGIRVDAGSGLNRDSHRLNRGGLRRPITYSHTEEEHVVGLEEDINKWVGLLTTDAVDTQVLSIVGMGGSGKTTLARKLYNHQSVKGHFDCIVWLSISQEWAAQQILRELLRKASGKKDETCRTEELVEKIHHYLEGKRYLIVLDDVWTKRALEEIFPAFPMGERRIIITTRNRDLVSFLDIKSYIHDPRRLTDEESWDLFRKKADLIHEEENNNCMDIGVLETLGKEMLKKCEGLPLAVIALAGILRKTKTIENWEKVKKAVSSWIMAEEGGVHLYGPVNKMLALSYNDLDRHLKPCFLYLAMYPEDTEIKTEQLIRLWIAKGFITSKMCKEGDTLEDVARDYLEELIDRCMVQIASNNYKRCVKSIRIHDLVRDLCIKKVKQQGFLKMSTSQSSHSDSRELELRRTVIYCLDKYCIPLPTQSPHLRSLIYLGCHYHSTVSLKNIHQHFRLLKVLNLNSLETSNSALPKEIGRLIHLRYVGLRNMDYIQLPASIGNLRNLLTLDCKYSTLAMGGNIILNFSEVEGLRHLYLNCSAANKGRVKLDNLKQLQTLKGIGGGDWMLEQLPLLSPTVQKLHIRHISSKEQLAVVLQCPSIKSDSLHSLGLQWNPVVLLENLQPMSHCQRLCKLYFHGRMEGRLSNCNQFPTSIIKLDLKLTGLEEVELAALGKRLPNLMHLVLDRNAFMGAKWSLMEDQFQHLKELHLASLEEWEEWSIEMGALPQLTNLTIKSCKKLRRLPEGLKFITTLQQLHIWGVGEELKKRSAKGGGEDGGGEDIHIIQHVPRIEIW